MHDELTVLTQRMNVPNGLPLFWSLRLRPRHLEDQSVGLHDVVRNP